MITPALIKDLKENRARIVSKGGQCNVNLTNVPKKGMQFFRDIFTTAVDMKWRYTMLVRFIYPSGCNGMKEKYSYNLYARLVPYLSG